MPQWAYCEACAEWVTLAPDGACQNGHPRSQLRSVQDEAPRFDTGTKNRIPLLARLLGRRYSLSRALLVVGAVIVLGAILGVVGTCGWASLFLAPDYADAGGGFPILFIVIPILLLIEFCQGAIGNAVFRAGRRMKRGTATAKAVGRAGGWVTLLAGVGLLSTAPVLVSMVVALVSSVQLSLAALGAVLMWVFGVVWNLALLAVGIESRQWAREQAAGPAHVE